MEQGFTTTETQTSTNNSNVCKQIHRVVTPTDIGPFANRPWETGEFKRKETTSCHLLLRRPNDSTFRIYGRPAPADGVPGLASAAAQFVRRSSKSEWKRNEFGSDKNTLFVAIQSPKDSLILNGVCL
jgi:hypothetical protein